MFRCLELARLGAGTVSPNPMVGSVIVYRDKIIGEGFHQKYSGPHAEVNAINAVKYKELLKKSTLYVNLEPCTHYGMTPPCSDKIIKEQIPKVVIGTIDPFAKVSGKGVERLKKAGVEVTTEILEKECIELNKRFFTFHNIKRPYIILKWAQTLDGFIDKERNQDNYGQPTWITGQTALSLVHKIRSAEDAILVGTHTAEKDNPSLAVRHWSGRNPLRIVIDRRLRLPKSLKLFDHNIKTLVINEKNEFEDGALSYVKIDFNKDICTQILNELYKRNILSLIVEGGKKLIDSFTRQGLWDEAHIFIGNKFFSEGIKAPRIKGVLKEEEILDSDLLKIFRNHH